MTGGAPLFQADRVALGYHGNAVVVDCSFRIEAGARIALLGPNGAGKTTLLRGLAGDLSPLQGALLFDGRPLHEWDRAARARRVAYVPPALDIMATMPVSEFVALGRTPYVSGWQRFTPRDREAVEHALALTDLHALSGRLVHELSEGEKHRAMIAMGLAQEANVLLLDEPTAHLDIKHAWRLMELMESLHAERGITMVITAHDLNMAAAFCPELYLMHEGRLVAQGSPGDVLNEERLSRVYDYPVRVVRDNPDQPLRVFPMRQTEH